MAAFNATDQPPIKAEPDRMSSGIAEPQIKVDPDSIGASPMAMSEDDIYEDAGDLDFSHYDQNVYLMRLPKYLWENWANIGDDEQIKLGTLRVENVGQDEIGQEKSKFTMLLSHAEANRGLPREYNVPLTNSESANTYIFTEKDLPGYRPKVRGMARSGPQDGVTKSSQPLAGLRHPERDRVKGQPKWERGRRGQPYYKKAIPKQTALAGVVKHEMTCVPTDIEEETRYLESKAKKNTKPRETMFLGGVGPAAGNLLDPGTLGSGGGFSKFIKTSRGPQKGKVREAKNARIAQNELLDLIFSCFSQFSYWHLKSLKAKLNQPEQYLRENLETVAELVKTGRFSNTWTLKPEYKVDQYRDIKEELAPEDHEPADGGSDMGEDDGADDEDEDEVKMEDVLPRP